MLLHGPYRDLNRCYLAAAIALLLVLPALWVDLAVSRFFLAERLPGDVRIVLVWSEVFAHGVGVALVTVLLACFGPRRWHLCLRAALVAYASGLTANLAKLVTGRQRPRSFLEQHPDAEHAVESFLRWFPSSLEHRTQSFPSAHTATAVAFAVALSLVYPRARWCFFSMAVLAATQRLDAGAHYASDIMAGAAIGFLMAALLNDARVLARRAGRPV